MSILRSKLFQDYPQGCVPIFLTQALFNFGFFGFKSIVILYNINIYGLKERESIEIFATFMALSYATSLIGGFLADKFIGPRNTLLIGGVLSGLGVLMLICALERNIFFALTLLTLGSGCVKPNLSALLTLLFKDAQDIDKDSVFTTLYVAMNLGGFTGPFVCGLVSSYYGWHSSFLLITLSFLGGACLFFFQTKYIKVTIKPTTFIQLLQAVSILIICIGFLYFLFQYRNYFNGLMGIIVCISLICFCAIFYYSSSAEREGLVKTIPYILLFGCFCALFEQAGSSIMLFFDKMVNRQIFSFTIPSSSLLSLDPIFVLIFGMIIPHVSKSYLDKNSRLDGLTKFCIGFFFISFSFGVLALSSSQGQTQVLFAWVVLAIFVQTMGELFIVPVGLANISKFAPSRYLSLMMSLWLMAISYGHYFAGIIASFSLSSESAEIGNSLRTYYYFFLNLSILSLSVAVILLVNVLRKYKVSTLK